MLDSGADPGDDSGFWRLVLPRTKSNTSEPIGGARGIAALSTIATSQTGDSVAAGSALPVALDDGFTAPFVAGVVIAALGIVAALTLI